MDTRSRILQFLTGKRPVVGLDVGQSSAKAVILSTNDNGVQVLASERLDFAAEGFIGEDDFCAHLPQWLADMGYPDAELVLGLAQDMTNLQVTNFPPNSGDSLDSMVAMQTAQLAELSENTFMSDYAVMPALDDGRLPVVIGVCLENLVQERVDRYEQLGVHLTDLGINGLAAVNACFDLKTESREGTGQQLVLDIGAASSTLVIAAAGRVQFATTLQFGAQQCVEALAEKQGIDPEKVIASRQRFHIAHKKKSTRDDPLSRLGETLAEEINGALAQWREQQGESADAKVNISSFYLCGGGAVLTPIATFLERAFHCSSAVLRPPLAGEPDQREDAPLFATAYGLALQGIGVAHYTISLAPERVRWEAQRIRRTGALTLATAILILFLLTAFIVQYTGLHSAHARLTSEREELNRCEEIVQELRGNLNRLRALETAQLPLVERGNRGRRYARTLRVLGRARGADDWFVYVGDKVSFDRGKAPEPDGRRSGREKPDTREPGHSIFSPRRIQDDRETAHDASAYDSVVVVEMNALTTMVAAGYTPFLPAERYKPVRRIVSTLNESTLFSDVDLMSAEQARGREDIFLEWGRFLHRRERQRGQESSTSINDFIIRLPFATPVIHTPREKQEAADAQ